MGRLILASEEVCAEELDYPDLFDWRGCTAVEFDPEKLSGRASVLDTRMDADGVMLNFEDGMTAEEISEGFGSDLKAVRTIIAFGSDLRQKARA